jgi:tetratricopeptide (TPR) repeat protein
MAETHRDEIAKLEALYAAHPEGRVFTHLAEAYRKAGDLARAKEILETGLARHSDYSSAHVVLGRVLIDLGDTRSAAVSFRRVLELDRHNLVALRSLGEIATQHGNTEEALGYYRDLLSLDPTDERLRLTVARLETQAEAPAGSDEAAAEEPAPATPAAAAAGGEHEEIAAGSAIPDAGDDLAVTADEPAAAPLWPDDVPPEEVMPLAEITFSAFGPPADETEEAGEPLSVDWTTFPAEGALAGDEPERRDDDQAMSLSGGFIEGEAVEETGDPAGTGFAAWSAFPLGGPDQPAGEGYEDAADSVDLDRPEPEGMELAGAEFGEDPAMGTGALDEAEEDEVLVYEASFEETLVEEDADGPVLEADVEGPADPAKPAAEPEPDDREAEMSIGSTDGELLTVTMAELYANQGIYDRAAEVYRTLLAQVPDDPRLREGLAQMESRVRSQPEPASSEEIPEVAPEPGELWLESVESAWTGGSGVAGQEETPYAWADTSAGEESGGPPIGEYFGSLLRWRPGGSTTDTQPSADVDVAMSTDLADVGDDADEVELEAGAVEAAFEEWFGPEGPGRPTEEPAESAADAAEEADADLEMFRSWLQSLKK